MKFSDVPGDRAIEVLAGIIDMVSAIASDKELLSQLNEEDGNARLGAVPGVLRRHKTEVVAIIAALYGVTPDEYLASHNAAEVMRDATDILTDDSILGFGGAAQLDAGSRGDASASIGDHAA